MIAQDITSDDDDFYSVEVVENLLEKDEISSEEEAFMKGYLERAKV